MNLRPTTAALISTILTLCLALPMFAAAAAEPRVRLVDHEGGSNPYSSPYSNPYDPGSLYPDGTSRGQASDEEYYRYRQQEQQRLERNRRNDYDAGAPPAYAGPKDFNVWKDGKPTLCTQTKRDVVCY